MQNEVQTLVKVYFQTVALQYGLDQELINRPEDLWKSVDVKSERPEPVEDVNKQYKELRSQIVTNLSITPSQPAPVSE